jgi:hypothetical protein
MPLTVGRYGLCNNPKCRATQAYFSTWWDGLNCADYGFRCTARWVFVISQANVQERKVRFSCPQRISLKNFLKWRLFNLEPVFQFYSAPAMLGACQRKASAENSELNISAQSRNQAFIRLTENLTDFKVSWNCGREKNERKQSYLFPWRLNLLLE